MQNCVVLSGVFFFQLAGISNYHIYNIDNTDNFDEIDNLDTTYNRKPCQNKNGAASAAPF